MKNDSGQKMPGGLSGIGEGGRLKYGKYFFREKVIFAKSLQAKRGSSF
jgi:hypothetical protein